MRYMFGILYLSWIGLHDPNTILITAGFMGFSFGIVDYIREKQR